MLLMLRKLFYLSALLVGACNQANFLSHSTDSSNSQTSSDGKTFRPSSTGGGSDDTGRPSEEGEGMPGYLTSNKISISYLGDNRYRAEGEATNPQAQSDKNIAIFVFRNLEDGNQAQQIAYTETNDSGLYKVEFSSSPGDEIYLSTRPDDYQQNQGKITRAYITLNNLGGVVTSLESEAFVDDFTGSRKTRELPSLGIYQNYFEARIECHDDNTALGKEGLCLQNTFVALDFYCNPLDTVPTTLQSLLLKDDSRNILPPDRINDKQLALEFINKQALLGQCWVYEDQPSELYIELFVVDPSDQITEHQVVRFSRQDLNILQQLN